MLTRNDMWFAMGLAFVVLGIHHDALLLFVIGVLAVVIANVDARA